MRNNFQRLEEKKLEKLKPVPDQIRENIHGSRNLFGLIGNVLDLFIPKLLSLLTHMLSGSDHRPVSTSHPKSKYPNQNAEE